MPTDLRRVGKRAKQDYMERHKVARVELLWPHAEPLNPDADIADIVVHMEDGARFRGTVTTLQFIRDTMERARKEGDEAEGSYWFADAIIMARIDESKLQRIVEDLIDSFMFEKAFQRAEAGTMA
ncbi:MAG TPA: hypothetical protein VJV23_08540 [Candidatus Polarisedimenticolia bacterium]|nr:hypothetical protein [Candidatus Polarisedimenticolia bacterium]